MTELDALLAGIVSEPLEETRWLVLADWLQEHDDPRRAELLRLHRKMIATCCEPATHPERAAWQARMTELLVAGVRPCVPQETLILPGGVPMTFAFIPPGASLMGSEYGPHYDEKPVHRVEMTRGFFLGMTSVTQAQWEAVMATDPSEFKGPERPVERVSWDDCQEFCSTLSELIGRKVELPTESEWECACRAGTTTANYFGDVLSTDLANYYGNNFLNAQQPVKNHNQTTDATSFPANPWGLFDLHGNVWEWCANLHGPYPGNQEPRYTRTNTRTLRGGCWSSPLEVCYTACRSMGEPTNRFNISGFRACLRIS